MILLVEIQAKQLNEREKVNFSKSVLIFSNLLEALVVNWKGGIANTKGFLQF